MAVGIDHSPLRPDITNLGDALLLRLPYWPALVSELRLIGTWDVEARGWRVPWTYRSALTRILEPYGLALAQDLNVLRQERGELLGLIAELRRQTHGADFRALFGAVPERLRHATYRSLARVLHPDVGGDPELMKALNHAHDEVVA